ncbi:MAG: hypothetical protein IIZ33_02560, partial [Erysipelotrichaceae bacterium]|nr:hypothetical protein [Erysipelotrichaceae bacterium]
ESPDYNEIKRSDEDISESGKMIVVSIEFNGSYHRFVATSDRLSECAGIVKTITQEDDSLLHATLEDGREMLFRQELKDEFTRSQTQNLPMRFLCENGYYFDDPDKREIFFAESVFPEDTSTGSGSLYSRMKVDANELQISISRELSPGYTGGTSTNINLYNETSRFKEAMKALGQISFNTEGSWDYSPYEYEVFFRRADEWQRIAQKSGIYYLSDSNDWVPKPIGYVNGNYSLEDLCREFDTAPIPGDMSGEGEPEAAAGSGSSNDPIEEDTGYYRISDLLGDPVSIRVTALDYGSDYDHVFEGEELKELMTSLYRAVVAKDIEPVKGAGGIGLDITITYEDGTVVNAGEGNFCFRLGDDVYPYPLESLENKKTFLEQFLLTIGNLELNG